MPIDIDEFEATAGPDRRPAAAGAANAERVLAFLTKRADRAYTPAEIRDGAGVPRGSVCVALSRLEDQEKVRHREAYWAAAAGTSRANSR